MTYTSIACSQCASNFATTQAAGTSERETLTAAERKQQRWAQLNALPASMAALLGTFLHAEWFAIDAIMERAADIDVRFNPWTHLSHGVFPLWDDGVVAAYSVERQALSSALSPHTPVCHHSALVRAAAFPIRNATFDDSVRRHPHFPWLLNGCLFGFSLMSRMAPQRAVMGTVQKPGAALEHTRKWVHSELEAGHMSDVTHLASSTPLCPLIISPATVVPKAGDTSGAVRVCQNLSARSHTLSSVNDHIDYEPIAPVDLLSLRGFCARYKHLRLKYPGQQIWAAKCDLKSYFRQCPIRLRDRWMTAQQIDDLIAVHDAFSFGAASAVHSTSRVTFTASDRMARDGHYAPCFLDDIVFLGLKDEVNSAIVALRELLSQWKLVENLSKHVTTTQQLAVIGVHFDLSTGVVWVADERRASIVAELSEILAKQKSTIQLLRHVLGRLSFVSEVVPFGRCYAAAVWRLLQGHDKSPGTFNVRITAPARLALQWWHDVLLEKRFPRTSLNWGVQPDKPLYIVAGLQTDAAQFGFGAVSHVHAAFIRGEWTADQRSASINRRECLAIAYFLSALGPLLSGSIVLIESDNLCSVFALHRQSADNDMLRLIVTFCVALQEAFRFTLIVRHLAGQANAVADSLSRGRSSMDSLPTSPTPWSELRVHSEVLTHFWIEQPTSLWVASLVRSLSPERRSNTSTTSFISAILESSDRCAADAIPWLPYVAELRAPPLVSLVVE